MEGNGEPLFRSYDSRGQEIQVDDEEVWQWTMKEVGKSSRVMDVTKYVKGAIH